MGLQEPGVGCTRWPGPGRGWGWGLLLLPELASRAVACSSCSWRQAGGAGSAGQTGSKAVSPGSDRASFLSHQLLRLPLLLGRWRLWGSGTSGSVGRKAQQVGGSWAGWGPQTRHPLYAETPPRQPSSSYSKVCTLLHLAEMRETQWLGPEAGSSGRGAAEPGDGH